MNDAVLRERVAQGVVLFTSLGLVSWIIRPVLESIGRASVATPWTFYGGLVCFAIALVALVTVVYLDETHEFEEDGKSGGSDRSAR